MFGYAEVWPMFGLIFVDLCLGFWGIFGSSMFDFWVLSFEARGFWVRSTTSWTSVTCLQAQKKACVCAESNFSWR